MCAIFEFRRVLLGECNSHDLMFFFPAENETWRIRVGAAHGMFCSLRDGFGFGLSVLQRWVPVWPVLVRA